MLTPCMLLSVWWVARHILRPQDIFFFFCIEPSIWPLTVSKRLLNWVMACSYSMGVLLLVSTHWGQDEIAFICRHFQMHFCNEIIRISVDSSLKIFPSSPVHKVSVGASNGLALNLNQRWLNLLMHICFTRSQTLNNPWWFRPFDNCCTIKSWMGNHFVYGVYECLQETKKYLFILSLLS